MKIRKYVIIAATVFLSAAALSGAETDERVEHTTSTPSMDIWEIHNPNVKQAVTHYRQIAFKSGDEIKIYAAGGVQTGGSGKTWKLYVAPRGPNSDKLYHGLVRIPPGPNLKFAKSPTVPEMVRIRTVLNKKLKFEDSKKLDSQDSAHLVLGYEDDGYGDNGYYGHDDGTDDQTKGVGPAWVKITITHKKTN